MRKTLFIHRSVGQHVLDHTHLRSELRARGIELFDLNANDLTIGNESGRSQCAWTNLTRGATTPGDFGQLFSDAMTENALRMELGSYDAIIIKSCYTIWAASTDKIRRYILPYDYVVRFALANPNVALYLATPPPPRRRYDANRMEVIRTFVQRMKQLGELPNIKIIDFYGTLVDESGRLAREYRRLIPFDQHPNRRGSRSLASVVLDVAGGQDVDTR